MDLPLNQIKRSIVERSAVYRSPNPIHRQIAVKVLSTAQLAALSTDQENALTTAQVANLTTSQIAKKYGAIAT